MRCRIAGFLRCAPSEVLDLPAVDVDLLALFYDEEPWGAWRDNLHAAIIAREVRRGWVRNRAGVKLKDFFYRLPERDRKQNLAGFADALRMMAGGRRIHISEYKPPKRHRKNGRPRKAGSSPRGAVGANAGGAGQGKPKDRSVR